MGSQDKKIIQDILKEFESVFGAHKGGAEIMEVKGDTVVLKIKGRCKGCALAPLTFGLGIERLIKKKLPKIKTIRYIDY